MRPMLALLLLSSFCLCGCKLPMADNDSIDSPLSADEEFPSDDPTSGPSGSDRSPSSSSEPEGFLGPDPFAAAPSEPQGLLGAGGKHSGVWVNFYYFPKYVLCESELAKIKGWANEKGLTVASAGEANFRYAKVRLIDVTDARYKVERNLVYDGNKIPLFPTLVLLDEAGCDLCHNIGYINLRHLEDDFDKFSRTPSRKRGMMSLPPEEVKEIKYEPGAKFHMECSGGSCRMVRH